MKYSIHKSIITGLVLQSLAYFPLQTMAGPVTVPNTFTSGTTARASEVNGNFSAVETAVNDNDVRISANANAVAGIATNGTAISSNTTAIAANQTRLSPVVVDGANNEIGMLLSIDDDAQFVNVLTDQGYVIDGLELGSGESGGRSKPLWFVSANCTGTAYLSNTPSGFITLASDLAGGSTLYYVAKESIALSNFSFGSTDQGGCSGIGGTLPFVWPALPNDPTITGVSSQPYQLPIIITRP